MRRGVRNLLLACGVGAFAWLGACEPYRIEYRRRPALERLAGQGPQPDREVLEDGTIVVYSTGPRTTSKELTDAGDAERFTIRKEQDDGTITLRALLPQHVVALTLHSLRHEEYALLWDQLVSERTKNAYRDAGEGVAEFTAFFSDNRIELAKLLNRMRIGLATHETVVETGDDGVITCRLWPQAAVLFRFRKLEMVREDYGLKLLMIR